jgi:hypothetical protein
MIAQEAVYGWGRFQNHADLSTDEAWILGQLLESCRRGAEEQCVDRVLLHARHLAEFGW